MSAQQIGPWQLSSPPLGEGGMGVVYRATNDVGRAVALKVSRTRDADVIARLRSEIHALTAVHHPGVVALYDHGVHDGVPWYAMELLEGRTLRGLFREVWPPSRHREVRAGSGATFTGSLLDANVAFGDEDGDAPTPAPTGGARPQPANGRLAEVLRLFHQMCAPLAVIHGRAIVHRDLKPENVFLRPDGRPVLMDLGLVSRSRGGIGRERIEVAGRVVGTLSYMAPEQANGQIVDARADLYALGAMLYEALTGRRAVEGGSIAVMLNRILTQDPIPPSELVDGLAPDLDELVMRLLAKNPRNRLGHADDVAAALAACGAAVTPDDYPMEGRPYLYRPGFQGREDIRGPLEQRVDDVAAGVGGLVFVVGDSGAGKTFLVSEVARLAAAETLRVVTAECLPVGAGDESSVIDVTGAPLHPFRRFLLGIADAARNGGARTTAQLLGERAPILAPYEPALAEVPGFRPLDPAQSLPAEAARRRVVAAMVDTLVAAARHDGGALLVVDDLQWADDLTLSVIDALDPVMLKSVPLLVLGTWRSGEAPASLEELSRRPQVGRVDLALLGPDPVARMVADMLAIPEAPPRLVAFLVEQTRGNPFFVAEYLRAAVAEGVVVRKAGRWAFKGDVSDLQALPAPGSLIEVVERRLDSVPGRTRALLELAAVYGRVGRLASLAAAAAMPEEELVDVLRDAVERQILELDDGGFRWTHDKLREAAYQRIATTRRPELHLALATALEAAAGRGGRAEHAQIARHWAAAGQLGKAVDAYEAAAEQDLREYAVNDAVEHFGSALALNERQPGLAGPTRRARWQRGIVEARLATGASEEVLPLAHAAVEGFGFPMPSSRLGLFAGVFAQVLTRMAQSVVVAPFRPSSPVVRAAVADAAWVYNRMVEPYFLANRPIEGTYVGLRSINLGERVPDASALVRGLGFMCMILGATPLQGVARAWETRALSTAERLGQLDTLAYVLARTAAYDLATARWGDVHAKCDQARRIAEGLGDHRTREEVNVVEAQALLYEGRLAEAVPLIQSTLDEALARGDRQTTAWCRCFLVLALNQLGRAREAVAVFEASTAGITTAGDGERGLYLAAGAASYLVAGDLAAARTLAEQALACMHRAPPVGYYQCAGVVATAEAFASLYRRTEDPALLGAARESAKILVSFSRMYPFARAASERAAAALAELDGRDGVARRRYATALDLAQRMQLRVDTGLAAMRLARLESGEAQARHLATASAAFQDAGTAWMIEPRRG